MLDLTSNLLRQAAELKAKIATLQTELNRLLGAQTSAPVHASARMVTPRLSVLDESAGW